MRFGIKLLKATVVGAIVGFAGLTQFAATAQAQNGMAPQLFANQYTQGYANQTNAVMYISPVPVPEHVGHTYYTYQPLYPHEMMHLHSERYHSYYDQGRGLNRTGVHYYVPPVRTGVHGLWKSMSLAR